MPPKKSSKKSQPPSVTRRATRSSTKAQAAAAAKDAVIDSDDNNATTTTNTADESKKEIDEATDDPDLEMSSIQYCLELIERSMNTKYFIQIMILIFITNVVYLSYYQNEEVKETDIWPFYEVCIVLVGVIAQFFIVFHSHWKSYTKNIKKPIDERPPIVKTKLPDFNLIYSVFLPLFLVLLKSHTQIPLIAGCVMLSADVHYVAKLFVAYVVEYQLVAESEETYGLVLFYGPLVHFMAFYLLDNVVDKKSISNTEKNMLATLFVVLNFFVSSKKSNTVLVIFQRLFIAFSTSAGLCGSIHYYVNESNSKESVKYAINCIIHLLFYCVGVFISFKFLTPLLQKNPFTWLVDFINETETRLTIFKVWCAESILITPLVFKLASYLSLDYRRKIWHFIIFASLCYPIVVDSELVSLALVGLLGIFIFIELQRSINLPPFGSSLTDLFKQFQDEKDTNGLIILSYVYLILGIALPIWINNCSGSNESISGLITIGLGDSLASLIGGKYGKFNWPHSKKTIEGSIAFFIVTALSLFGFKYLEQNDFTASTILTSSLLTATLEGCTDMNDNLIIPVFMSISLMALQKV